MSAKSRRSDQTSTVRTLLVVLRLGLLAGRGPLCWLVLLTPVAALGTVAAGWLTKAVLDGLTTPPVAAGTVLGACAALAGVTVTIAAVPYLREYTQAEFGRRVGLLAQDRLHAAVNRLVGLARFEDPAFLDRLGMAQGCGAIPANLVGGLLRALQAVIMTGGFLLSLATTQVGLTLFLLVASVPMFVAELRLVRHLAVAMDRIGSVERRANATAALLCEVRSAREIRMFGAGDWFGGRSRADRQDIDATNRALDRRRFATQLGLALLSAVAAMAGLVWAVLGVARGTLTVGDIALFLAAIAGVQSGMGAIATGASAIRRQLLTFGHYRAVVEAEVDLPVPAKPQELPALRCAIELRDVWFRYGPDQPWVLRGINLSIPHGRSLALVGGNGAGKSTLVKLLCRFYDPQRGAVLWDGVDIRDVAPEHLRARMTVLFQEFVRYDLTAGENIAVGDLTRVDDPAALSTAARLAGVDHVLRALPRGYGTMLSRVFHARGEATDDGAQLSGGQWQRVALARALLRQPRDLIVLDEPTSGLDPGAAHELHREVRGELGSPTRVIVTHHLGGARQSDMIAVLEHGEVVQSGSHRDLVAAAGWYAQMVDLG